MFFFHHNQSFSAEIKLTAFGGTFLPQRTPSSWSSIAATKIIGSHPIKLFKKEKEQSALRTGVYRIAATGIIIVDSGLYQ
jgi:hypothetical protein